MLEGFHHWNDGRGPRRVFVNGNEVWHAIWADTKRGVVEYHPIPFRFHKNRRDEIYTRRLRGVVTVELVAGNHPSRLSE